MVRIRRASRASASLATSAAGRAWRCAERTWPSTRRFALSQSSISKLAEVLSADEGELLISLGEALEDDNEVVLTFDPFAIVKVNVRA